ncbi:ribbon-helix-helix domain-containing protein [Sphingomonas sp. GB1N7]|uniref:ribbon-helix-helix domain-containing protein n=1 Tax=Parasphingomonas caseinilytica TaxID=3096158 RepID=UPI002FC65902
MGAARKLNIELSEDLASRLEDAAVSGGYRDVGALIGDLLSRWDGQQDSPAEIARLRVLIEEGLASGEGGEVTEEWFEDIKRRGHEQVASMRRAT